MANVRTKARLVTALVMLAGLGVAVSWIATHARATDQNKAAVNRGNDDHAKGPIAELMKCPLAFAGVHLMKDDPRESRIAYHFCMPVNDDLAQCVLYDGTGPDARLIGIEYLVSDAVYRTMPDEEKALWHDHKFEVDTRLLKSLTQSGDDERKTLAQVRPMWGKVYHTWVDGKTYPRGPARLFWSVTGKKPFVLPDGVSLPPELRP